MSNRVKEKSALQQTGILIARQTDILRNNLKKIGMIVLLPVATAIIVSMVASDKVFESYEDTKSIMFAIVCVSIWIGIFNSIQEICQEREILKREYMANLKLSAYILSKFIVQAILCLGQTIIFLSICCAIVEFPEDGIIFKWALADIFVTVFLIMLASDSIGLLVSSIVKSGDIANIIAPIILILQLVMSGVLFELDDFTEKLSYITISKWGMDALGSIANLNDLEMNLFLEATDEQTKQTLKQVIERESEDIFSATSEHILMTWGIIAIFTIVMIMVSALFLRRVTKDSR